MDSNIGSELWSWKPNQHPRAVDVEDEGVRLDAIRVSYSVTADGKQKQLLRDISLRLDSGELCALMGSSGSGKSTLLDLLADRKREGMWSGDFYVNMRPRSFWFNRESAYVLQDDCHIATLTVEETIRYAAWTRMPEGTHASLREARVQTLLDLMGIAHIKDSLVGDSMIKGISGGQLKRLSIAVEIIHLPHLIFLDEPTSGLDSSIALEVMSAVRKLTEHNRTIVSTIHQPSPEVFRLFHKVILLSAGRMIYCGPADEVVAHFTRPDLGYKYHSSQNPAEFIVNICGGQINPEGSVVPRTADDLADRYARSKFYEEPANPASFADVPEPTVTYTRRHTTGKLTQFSMLMSRSWVAAIRDVNDLRAQFGKNVVIGTLIGIVFFNQAHVELPTFVNGVPTPQVSNVNALLYFAMLYCLLSNLQAIPALCARNQIYRRELASFSYAASPYWLSQCIVYLPLLIANHLFFTVVVFAMCQFSNQVGYFFYFYFVLLLANLSSYYVAMLLASSTGSPQIAFAIYPVIFLFLGMFSGFTIHIDNVPPLWSWATYVSYTRWAFEGLMVNHWSRLTSPDTVYGDDNLDSDGFTVLQSYDFQNFSYWSTFGILILYILAIMGMVYLAMRPRRSRLVKLVSGTDDEPISRVSNPLNKKGYIATNLEEGLLENDSLAYAAGKSGELDLETVETFAPQTTFDVNWYRHNTGEVQLSRGCRLVFRNIMYSIPVEQHSNPFWFRSTSSNHSGHDKQILRGVSGRAHPGEMCALMGASGAGKSTLLDILAGRKNVGVIQGEILFNGMSRSPSILRSSAYVMQDNVHIPVLTVKQTLLYAASLRLPQETSLTVRCTRVLKIMDMLGLTGNETTIVGGANGGQHGRGISGGQLKRLSIGVEIIHMPDLIFLDEPTSGLDSSIAYEVMAAVRNLANQNRTVLCTIHQPSADTYALFDKLLLLAEGRVIYFGPSRDVVNYFVTSPYRFPFTSGSNPADYFIAVAGSFLPSGISGKRVGAAELAAYYSSGDLCKVFLDNIDTMLAMDLAAVGQQALHSLDMKTSIYPTSTLHQTLVLCHRTVFKTYMNRGPIVVGFIRHILIGLFFGSIFYHLEDGTDSAAYTNRMSLLFFCLIFLVVGHQQSIPNQFEDRLVFYRERGSKLYGAIPYWISCWIVELPVCILDVFVFAVIVYNMAGLNKAPGRFGFFYGQLLLASWAGQFQCQLVAALSPSPQVAISAFPVALFVAITFAGYIVLLPSFNDWLRTWAPYLSILRYPYQALVLNEFDGNENLPYSQSYIDQLGFNDYSRYEVAPANAIFAGFFAFLFLLALRHINFEKR